MVKVLKDLILPCHHFLQSLCQSALMKWIELKHQNLELILSDERQEHNKEHGLQLLWFTSLKDKEMQLMTQAQGLEGYGSKPWSELFGAYLHTGSRPWSLKIKTLTFYYCYWPICVWYWTVITGPKLWVSILAEIMINWLIDLLNQLLYLCLSNHLILQDQFKSKFS